MDKRHKDVLRGLVLELRHQLLGTQVGQTAHEEYGERGDLDREMERLGFTLNGDIQPIDVLPFANPYEQHTYHLIFAQLYPLTKAQRIITRHNVVERAAYTWMNRLLALRAMEARSLIDPTLRGDEDYDGLSEKLYLLRLEEPQRATEKDGGWWAVIEDACHVLEKALPGLFALDTPDLALRPSTTTLLHCIALVTGTVPLSASPTPDELDVTFADPDAIGWAYQFYQQEVKDQVYSKLKSGGKAETREEIAAATQLFTEPYMVQWLLQNSLGRSYIEIYPDSNLPTKWPYYVQPEQQDGTAEHGQVAPSLSHLTVIDPCMGSGHFLREAFDMLVVMYREQYPLLSAQSIADTILRKHLYGIDLDPRAAQLSALTLYMRSWELVRMERRQRHQSLSIQDVPYHMNLATTPQLPNGDTLQRHLQRHPEDVPLEAMLKEIFASLKQADILGSLLRPREYLETAIAALQKPETISLEIDQSEADWYRSIRELANRDSDQLIQLLLHRIIKSFEAETENSDDVSTALFGRAALEGVRLVRLLVRQYAIVVTNPPYMGSKNMDAPLKRYVESYYPSGKRDLYAAFILRCLELCQPNGQVAMVTPHSWMFLRSYTDVRKKLITQVTLKSIAHLGSKTFKELSNSNALGFVLFIIVAKASDGKDTTVCFRLVHSHEKRLELHDAIHRFNRKVKDTLSFSVNSSTFLKFPNSVIFYWSPQSIITAFLSTEKFSNIIDARQGLITANNNRFIRSWWEVRALYWKPYSKGGSYRKWFGNQELVVDWDRDGTRIKEQRGPSGRQKSRPQNTAYYFREGGTWTGQSSYGFSVRYLPKNFIFDAKGPAFFIKSKILKLPAIIAFSNSKVIQFIFSAIQPTIDYGEGYLMGLPLSTSSRSSMNDLSLIGEIAIGLKRRQIAASIVERDFEIDAKEHLMDDALIHTLDGLCNLKVCQMYSLLEFEIQLIIEEVGTPVGWYPLITYYDALPSLLNEPELSSPMRELFANLAQHERVTLDEQELRNIKAKLRVLYEVGPGVKEQIQEEESEMVNVDEESEMLVTGEHIPIPTETFLEELSVKMCMHPISIYWLLEDLRVEGVRCKPEEKRILEDRLTVLVLRLLGHRWPKQLEVHESIPSWTESEGIIPLVAVLNKMTIAECVRQRLINEDGAVATQRTEALLQELTGYTLEEWLCQRFFQRHISQFKSRPIAWHLVSTPVASASSKERRQRGTGGTQRRPAFECLLYYHACASDVLARIRTYYIEPLIRIEQAKIGNTATMQQLLLTNLASDPPNTSNTLEVSKARGESNLQELASAIATERLHELESFVEKLRRIEECGFAAPDHSSLLLAEPLDRWAGNGYTPPATREMWLRMEEAWHVDINDGVRVNIAPLQLAGVLAKDVLVKRSDAQKAITDRSHWRADERRWVREGKLPRCGWMQEHVPASEQWMEIEQVRNAVAVTKDAEIEQQTLTMSEEKP